MSTKDELDINQRRVLSTIITAYQPQIRTSIEDTLKTKIPQIDGHNIIGYVKHKGAGGTTYILQSEFLSGARRIQGGIVVKFANELEEDMRNAQDLGKIMKIRAQEWEKSPPNKPLPDWMPRNVFSPKVLGTHPTRKVLILEFVGGGIPLRKANFPDEQKYQMLGYALGRLHGSQSYQTAIKSYNPMFNLLEEYLPDNLESLEFWKKSISNSKGACQFIHGDSHLENLMYASTSNSLAWIDALLIPRGDRMDDLTYAISHIIQEEVISIYEKNPNESSKTVLAHIIRLSARSIVPLVLTTYMRTTTLKGLYDTVIPVDFFLGAHLIIRSQLFTKSDKIAKILIIMGTQFIVERPLGELLGISKI